MNKSTFLFYFLFVNFFMLNLPLVLALSPLPKNAYLRLGDNMRAVRTLQEILNSSPDTEITDQGPGSPGNENWYFGSLTEIALKKFQEKNGLEVTGKIDFKTWKVINNYVTGAGTVALNSPPLQGGARGGINQKIILADEKRKNINEQNKKDFEEARKAKIEKDAETKNLVKESKKSYIQSLIDKTTGYFTGNKEISQNSTTTPNTSTTPEIYANNYSAKTPYLNPNNGIYSSSPNNANPQTPGNSYPNQQSPQNQFLPPGGNPYLNYSASPASFGGIAPTMNTATYDSNPGGDLAAKFIKLPDGWLSGRTSHFGTEMNGSKDTSYAPYGSDWCKAAMNSQIDTCNPGICIMSLPISAQIYFFGTESQKTNLHNIRLLNTNKEQLAAAGGGNFYKRIGGTPFEVVNTNNNLCTVVPLWETGPGEKEKGNFVIDVTPCIKKTLRDSGTAFISKFRPVKAGTQGCEGYTFVKTLTK